MRTGCTMMRGLVTGREAREALGCREPQRAIGRPHRRAHFAAREPVGFGEIDDLARTGIEAIDAAAAREIDAAGVVFGDRPVRLTGKAVRERVALDARRGGAWIVDASEAAAGGGDPEAAVAIDMEIAQRAADGVVVAHHECAARVAGVGSVAGAAGVAVVGCVAGFAAGEIAILKCDPDAALTILRERVRRRRLRGHALRPRRNSGCARSRASAGRGRRVCL